MRTIKKIRDKDTREVFVVHELLWPQKKGFLLRDAISLGHRSFICCECDQDMKLSPSVKDNLYFSHNPNSNYCLLKVDNLENEIDDEFFNYLTSREGPRHEFLKNKIGEALKFTDGVEVSSIQIDNKFIIRDNEKRKPDVYCKYQGKELVFEIQWSPLSLHNINKRAEFYKKNKIFLIWVIDGDIEGQRKQLTRDLKWLDTHQNLFKLNEQSTSLKLDCEFKQPFINLKNELWEKWKSKTITLSDLTFDNDTFEVYFSNYVKEQKKKKDDLKKIISAELERKEKEKKVEEEKLIKDLIKCIESHKASGSSFFYLQNRISELSAENIIALNNKLNLMNRYANDLPVVSYYIRNYKDYGRSFGHSFIKFLLSEENIYLSVNDKDSSGRGCLQELYENAFIQDDLYYLLPLLFTRQYELTEFDKKHLLENSLSTIRYPEVEYLRLQYYNTLRDKESTNLIRQNFTYLLFIESAVQKRIIGSGLKNWVQYMMGIMYNYKKYWHHSKVALKYNGVWDLIYKTDKKGTFERKIKEFQLESAEQDNSILQLLIWLYPEVYLR